VAAAGQVRLFFNTFHQSAAAGTFDETFQRCIQHQIVEWTSGAPPLPSSISMSRIRLTYPPNRRWFAVERGRCLSAR